MTFTASAGTSDTVTFEVSDSSVVVLDRLVGHVAAGSGSPPDSEGPLQAEVGQSVLITALPAPAGAMFETGEPSWTFEAPPGSALNSMNVPPSADLRTLGFVPDVAGTYTISAVATLFDAITVEVTDPTTPEIVPGCHWRRFWNAGWPVHLVGRVPTAQDALP